MFLFVMYDISCDDDRAKFKEKLEGLNFKMIQESVYSCHLNADNVTRIGDKVYNAANEIYYENIDSYKDSCSAFNVVSIYAKNDHICQKIYKDDRKNITTIKSLRKLEN